MSVIFNAHAWHLGLLKVFSHLVLLADEYFGKGVVIDRQDIVDDYRVNVTESRVSFKLLTVETKTGEGSFAYLVIRGTVTPWDAMTDAQLWAPASLLQFLRIILPFGDMWTPVLPYLISSITWIESEALEQISFYKDTVIFAEWLREKGWFKGIAITGHSLVSISCIVVFWESRIHARAHF